MHANEVCRRWWINFRCTRGGAIFLVTRKKGKKDVKKKDALDQSRCIVNFLALICWPVLIVNPLTRFVGIALTANFALEPFISLLFFVLFLFDELPSYTCTRITNVFDFLLVTQHCDKLNKVTDQPVHCIFDCFKTLVLSLQVRYYARALAPRGITVNAVVPNFIMSESWNHLTASMGGVESDATKAMIQQQSPMKRFGKGSEFAHVVSFLCSPKASFITGVSLPVDGGFHLH